MGLGEINNMLCVKQLGQYVTHHELLMIAVSNNNALLFLDSISWNVLLFSFLLGHFSII